MGSTEDFGQSSPLGATLRDGGVNFSLYSRNASKVELRFFDREDHSNASRIIPINPGPNRTYHYWHTFVPGVQLGQVYGYRVYGPYEPSLAFALTAAKCYLTPTRAALPYPRVTAAMPPKGLETTLPRR